MGTGLGLPRRPGRLPTRPDGALPAGKARHAPRGRGVGGQEAQPGAFEATKEYGRHTRGPCGLRDVINVCTRYTLSPPLLPPGLPMLPAHSGANSRAHQCVAKTHSLILRHYESQHKFPLTEVPKGPCRDLAQLVCRRDQGPRDLGVPSMEGRTSARDSSRASVLAPRLSGDGKRDDA